MRTPKRRTVLSGGQWSMEVFALFLGKGEMLMRRSPAQLAVTLAGVLAVRHHSAAVATGIRRRGRGVM